MDSSAHAGAPVPPDDEGRLAAIRASGLDAGLEGEQGLLDDIAVIASRALGLPIAAVTVVDESDQWFAGLAGSGLPPVPRSWAFCAWAILEPEEVMVVPDATLDTRLSDNPQVTGDPYIRFYAGVPLRTPDRQPFGTLCVIDHEPHPPLDAEQVDTLRRLARQAESRVSLLAMARELDEAHQRTARAIDRERRFLHVVLDSLDDAVVACDASGVLSVLNPAARALHGLPATPIPPEEWASRYDLYGPDGRTPLRTEEVPLFRALSGEVVAGQEIVIAPEGLPRRRMRCTGQQLTSADGEVLGAVVAMHDITAQREAEDRLRHLADHDPLTGLPHRRALEPALLAAAAGGAPGLVAFIDLDGFKAINDEHGHAVGDRILVTVADRLVGAVEPGDLVARHGGDEFVVVCHDIGDASVEEVCRRLRQAVERPVHVLGRTIRPRISVGATPLDEDVEQVQRLVERADLAMYASRRDGRGGRRRSDVTGSR